MFDLVLLLKPPFTHHMEWLLLKQVIVQIEAERVTANTTAAKVELSLMLHFLFAVWQRVKDH